MPLLVQTFMNRVGGSQDKMPSIKQLNVDEKLHLKTPQCSLKQISFLFAHFNPTFLIHTWLAERSEHRHMNQESARHRFIFILSSSRSTVIASFPSYRFIPPLYLDTISTRSIKIFFPVRRAVVVDVQGILRKRGKHKGRMGGI